MREGYKRTFDPITLEDLREVARLSLAELNRFTSKAGNPAGKFGPYLERLIAVCLCQGAAQHYVDLSAKERFDHEVSVSAAEIRAKGLRVLPNGVVISGVKDVDVVLFFDRYQPVRIPAMRHCRKSIDADLPHLGKRRIDFMKKMVEPEVTGRPNASAVVRAYVTSTRHGRDFLRAKSVIGLYPESIMGRVIWSTRRYRAD